MGIYVQFLVSFNIVPLFVKTNTMKPFQVKRIFHDTCEFCCHYALGAVDKEDGLFYCQTCWELEGAKIYVRPPRRKKKHQTLPSVQSVNTTKVHAQEDVTMSSQKTSSRILTQPARKVKKHKPSRNSIK